MKISLLVAAVLSVSFAYCEVQVRDCRALQHHGKLKEADACFATLTRAADPFSRAEGFFGLRQYDDANNEFREADAQHPNSAPIKTEWGRLYAEHSQPGDAAKLFEEALEADPNYAPAYLNLGRILGENFDEKAVELAQQALVHDPKYVEAHEFLAYLALEDGDPKLASQEAQKALSLSTEALDGMAVLASIDWLNGQSQSPWMDQILAVNPAYGEAYATGAHFLVINYRYEEAIAFYRKALALNPALWSARSQLGVNLLRLGFNDEAKQNLVACYDAHFRDPETLNALRFLDKVGNFQTFKSGSTEIVLDKTEASLLYPYFEPELKKAIATYERKYQMKLPGPVRLEVYPNSADFLVRTIGLPAQVGLLGVTFGTVVAIESPSANAPGEYNWADTMWHELSHVYVVTATHHLVPRWFTEGLAVHEEHAASPNWGNRLTPEIIQALKQKKLLPVSDLDRGFVRPQFPGQVLVSYYQAGKICDYISEKWGDGAIVGMIHSYANRKTTTEAIQDNLHETPQAFDQGFQSWLTAKTANVVQHFDDWKKGMKAAYSALQSGDKDGALRQAAAIRGDYPEYIGKDSGYQLIADVDISKGDTRSAVLQLEQYRNAGGSDVETLKKLANMEHTLGQTDQMKLTLEMLDIIYPEDEYVHRTLGGLLLSAGQPDAAVREFRAVLALKPAAVAESHFNLATALNAAHRTSEAKDEVLVALEAAPDYKPAQHLLLQLTQ